MDKSNFNDNLENENVINNTELKSTSSERYSKEKEISLHSEKTPRGILLNLSKKELSSMASKTDREMGYLILKISLLRNNKEKEKLYAQHLCYNYTLYKLICETSGQEHILIFTNIAKVESILAKYGLPYRKEEVKKKTLKK